MSQEAAQALENLKVNVFELHNLLNRDYLFLQRVPLPESTKSFLPRIHEYSEYFKGAFLELRQDKDSIHLINLARACREFTDELDQHIESLDGWPDSHQKIFKNQLGRLFTELKSIAFNISVAQKIMHGDRKARQKEANEHLLIVENQLFAMESLIKKHSYLWESPNTSENLKKVLDMVPYYVGKQMSALRSKDLDSLLLFAERFQNGLNIAINKFPENISESLEDQRKKDAYSLFLHLRGRTNFLIKAAGTAKVHI